MSAPGAEPSLPEEGVGGEPAATGGVRVELERSGGVTGAVRRSSLDASSCPPVVAERVSRLVDEALAAGPPSPSSGRVPDRFSWSVRVWTRSEHVAVQLSETQLQGSWAELVRTVEEQGR